MEQQNKFNLSDLMTAAQAQKIIDFLEDLDKRVSALEVDTKNINSNVKELQWQDTYNHVAAMMEEAYPGCLTHFENN